MKSFINTAILLLLFVSLAFAQSFDNPTIRAYDSELEIDFGMATTALDSAATDTSGVFSLEDYDATDGDVFTLYTNLTSAGTPKCDISIHGCETPNGTYVSLDVIQDAEGDKGAVYTPFDIADKRAKYYKLIIYNEDTGAALTGYHIKIRASKKDFVK